MGLDSRMIALGHMGTIAYQMDWRGNGPILQLVKMFGGPEPDCFEDGIRPIVLDSDAIKCIARFLFDPILSLHLWGEAGDAEYHDEIIRPIFDEFKDAMEFADRRGIDFYFYASY